MSDPFDLARFVAAQDDGSYRAAVAELRQGRKRSHWMWFVFPQIAGLGYSSMAQRYAIGSLAEARSYLDHPVLGQRLREVAQIVAGLDETSPERVFGSIDAMKLHSSVTLFHRASPAEQLFQDVLDRFFDGAADAQTDRLLISSGT